MVVNDFTALAMSLPRLHDRDLRQVGGGQAVPRSVIGLIGAGTGLGESGLIPAGDSWISLGAEGVHASFAAQDECDIAELRHAWTQFGHVSFERLLSAAGLTLTYQALAELAGGGAQRLNEDEGTRRALAGSDTVCGQTLDLFFALPGTSAANLAVTLGASGSIDVGGAIVLQRGDCFDRSPFRARLGPPEPDPARLPVEIARAAQASQPTVIRFCRSPGCEGLSDFKLRLASGLPELLDVADTARARGASVLAITASQSPLARQADTVLALDHVEDSATQAPMISC